MNRSSILLDPDYYPFDDDGGGIVSKGPVFSAPTLERAIQTALVAALCLSATTSNLIVAAAVLSVPKRTQVLDFYVLSLVATNLLVSTLVIPLSSSSSHVLCSVGGYLHVSLSAVYMYTFMWVSVDRYLAVRKPLRYDIIQTRTRCKCWILFSWVMATCLCSPPLLGDSEHHFYSEGFMCLLDVNSMLPYSVTFSCLVLLPSSLTLCYTYSYVFTTPAEVRGDHTRYNSDHVATFLVTAVSVLLWAPWVTLRVVEQIVGRVMAGPAVRFWLLFLGQTHTSWSPLVLLSTCRRCQLGLRVMFKMCMKARCPFETG